MATPIHEAPTMLSGQAPRAAPLPLADTAYSGEAPARTSTGAGEARALVEGELPARIGRYLVIRAIGRGGMGVVAEAFDPELDRRVAIKLLRAQGGSQGSLARLMREAQAMARLSHPHVVQVYDVGPFEEQVFIAMELVDGQTLTAWQASARTWREVVEMYLEVGRGLAAAHAVGLVHRDFKPDNVLIGRDGRARVADFGLAREDLATAAEDEVLSPRRENPGERPLLAESLTATGAVMGTPVYMSPEQHSGLKAGPASDQFSFCVALFEALHGVRPFAGETLPQLAASVISAAIVAAPAGRAVPRTIEAALRRGLAPRPADRFPDLAALLAELARPLRRGRGWWIAGLAATSLGAAAVGYAAQSGEARACSGAAAEIGAVWTDAAEAGLDDHLRGAGLADDDRSRVRAGLDAYAQAWAEAHRDACLDHLRGENSAATFDLRTRCLAGRKDALAAAVEVLSRGDAAAARAASTVVAKLPATVGCADLGALSSDVAPPEGPELAAEVEATRRSLVHAQVVANSGQVTAALGDVAAARARSEALGYRPLSAEVALLEGRLAVEAMDYPRAVSSFSDAFVTATATKHDAIAAEAIARGLFVRFAATGDPEAALGQRGLAEALVERVGGRRDLAALLANNLGLVRFEADPAASAADFRRALELAGDGSTIDPIDFATGYLTNAASLSDDPAERTRLFEQAASTLADALGSRHLATLKLGLSWARREDDPERIVDLLAPRCPVITTDHAEQWETCDECYAGLAEAHADLGAKDAAAAALRAQEACLSVPAPEVDREPMEVRRSFVRGQLAALAGRPEEALADLQRARTTTEPYAAHRWIRVLLAGMDVSAGQTLLTLGRAGEAAAALERGLAAYDATEPAFKARSRRGAARARVALASALWGDAAARPRARELIAAAEAYYQKVGDAAGLRTIAAWRAAHPEA